jgi:hypothetical protein
MHTPLVIMGAQARRRTHLSVLATRFGLVAACMLLIGVVAPPVSGQSPAVAFTFTAVGDYGASSDTDAVLAAIANSGAVLNLALGDLSYGAVQPESAWCDYVKARVGASFPFELIAGNHDSGLNAAEGNINKFAACLPHRLGSLTGTYAKEYYFDYPATNPLARFILVSPKIDFQPGGYYSYSAGTTHYNWVRDAINAARAANIQWVIVGMHKLCLGTGAHTCEVETALMNLLISKKVDLILQAHDHTYQRSKQLAHTASCSSIAAGAYNSNCVVDDGQDNTYWAGSGSVTVISGMGGRSLYNISTADPENGYFVRWMGANADPTNGIMKFTISPTQLAADFVRASGGTFADRFVIDRPDLPPSNLIVSDSFTRVLTNGWGSAEIGGTYSGTDHQSLPSTAARERSP